MSLDPNAICAGVPSVMMFYLVLSTASIVIFLYAMILDEVYQRDDNIHHHKEMDIPDKKKGWCLIAMLVIVFYGQGFPLKCAHGDWCAVAEGAATSSQP